jgi:hypothetical protein
MRYADYLTELNVVQSYKSLKKQLGEGAGCYVVWGNSGLKGELANKKLEIHSCRSASVGKNADTVEVNLGEAIERAAKSNCGKWFCLYVGKTANMAGRPTHKFRKFSERAKLKSTNFGAEKFALSFVGENDWQDRFYLENFLIAHYLPIVNLQPER